MIKELKENEYLINKIQNDFLREYVESNLKWFIQKAVKNKYYYYICTLITIACPVISGVIFFVPIEDTYSKLISEIILGISTIAASMLPLFGYKRKWGIYRNQTEQMKYILAKYALDANNIDLISEIEKIKLQTHEKWMQPFNDK